MQWRLYRYHSSMVLKKRSIMQGAGETNTVLSSGIHHGLLYIYPRNIFHMAWSVRGKLPTSCGAPGCVSGCHRPLLLKKAISRWYLSARDSIFSNVASIPSSATLDPRNYWQLSLIKGISPAIRSDNYGWFGVFVLVVGKRGSTVLSLRHDRTSRSLHTETYRRCR